MDLLNLSKADIENLNLEESRKLNFLLINCLEDLHAKYCALEEKYNLLADELRILKGGNPKPSVKSKIKKPDPATREPVKKKRGYGDLRPKEILSLR